MELYENTNMSTHVLSEDTLVNVVGRHRDLLREADQRYRLDTLLTAMLEHAPHPLGQRYVAIALHIAHRKGQDAVVDLAKAWLDYLFLPSQFLTSYYLLELTRRDHLVLTMSRKTRTEPSGSQTPTIDTTLQHIEGADRSEQGGLRRSVRANN